MSNGAYSSNSGNKRVSASPAISRRSFVERLGLGAGAVLLSPIANMLISEARGQVVERKIAVFMLAGNGIHPDWIFTPVEFKPPGVGSEGTQYDVKSTLLDAPTTFTLPPMFKALEAYRSRMLLIDGLANRVAGPSHSTNYGALSAMGTPDLPEDSPLGFGGEGGPPGAITIDQYIANKLGATTPRKSVLYGISTAKTATAVGQYGIFAAGKNMPVPIYQNPTALYTDVFGKFMAPAPASTGPAPGAGLASARQRIIFDTLRGDITRLQGSLGPIEKRKLDTYLAAMEEFEKNQKALAAVAGSCTVPPAPMGTPANPVAALESMNLIAGLALACGVTNVAGVSCGCGPSHDTFPRVSQILKGTPYEDVDGHAGQVERTASFNILYNWLGKMMAQTIATLNTIRVGDKTLWDNSVFALTSENGEEHHATYNRWPIALFGNAGGKLRADGRFLRFPKRGSTGYRSMADLYCTIATALGIPTNDFAKGGPEPVKGPLELLM